MKIRAISQTDPLTTTAINGLVSTARILEDVEFYSKPGAADSLKKKRKGNTTEIFRTVNENNTAEPPTPEYIPAVKKIVSVDASVDVVLEDRNEDIDTELATETFNQCESAGYVLQEKIFEGKEAVATPNEFNGFRNLVPVAQVVPAGDNGLVLTLGNSDVAFKAQQVAIEKLLQFLALVRGGAQYAYMNEFLKIRWITIAKNTGYYRQSKDELGNTLDQIGNTIIKGAGYKEDGSTLLPFTETVGAAKTCSSIFAVRYGEKKELTALTSVGVKARYAGQAGNLITNNINLDMALVLQNPTALWQSSGWMLEEIAAG